VSRGNKRTKKRPKNILELKRDPLDMVLNPEVTKAFETLELTPDTLEDVAKSTYKKLALKHHPDRNHGDKSATQRFQQVRSSLLSWSVHTQSLTQ
jgi:hypothetical protein